MPYCPDTNTLFIHIPKTAGTSIEKSLGIYGRNNTEGNKSVCPELVFGGGMQHYTVVEVINYLSARNVDYDLNRSFAVLRDPVERFISHYKWTPKGEKSGRSVERFFSEIFLPSLGDKDVEARHRWPQSFFVSDLDNVPVVRYLIDFRRLASGYEYVVDRLGLPASDLPHDKRTGNPGRPHQQAPEIPFYIKRFLKAFYRDDILLLNRFSENCSVLETEPTPALRTEGHDNQERVVRAAAIAAIQGVTREGNEGQQQLAYGLACLQYKSGKVSEARSCLEAVDQRQLSQRARHLHRLLALFQWSAAHRIPFVDKMTRKLIKKA